MQHTYLEYDALNKEAYMQAEAYGTLLHVPRLSATMPPGYLLKRTGTSEGSLTSLLCQSSQEVVCHVECTRLKDMPLLDGLQVSNVTLWRSSKPEHQRTLRGFPEALIVEHVLAQEPVIACGQTPGRRFWTMVLGAALADTSLHCYQYQEGKLSRIHDHESVRTNKDNLWHSMTLISRYNLLT